MNSTGLSLLVACALIGTQGPCPGQPRVGILRGRVMDADFASPLSGVKVTCVEARREVETNEQGVFLIDRLPTAKYTLIFSKDGYAKKVRSGVAVLDGDMTEIDEELPGELVELPEFVVEDPVGFGGGTSEDGLLRLRFESPALMDSIGADLMKRAGAGDAGSALRLVAGATVKDGKSAVIRGLPDRYISSQLNRVRMPSADEDKRAVELDQFPSAVIESIQVAKTFTPDQQGDASGGAVNVRLRGIPDTPFFFKIEGQTSYTTGATGRDKFPTYEGGGVSGLGRDRSRRPPQLELLGEDWMGAIGTTMGEVPQDYKFTMSGGGRIRLETGFEFGTIASLFYERESSNKNRSRDDTYWIQQPGASMTPKSFQGAVQGGDFKTSLFDVTQGKQAVQWGGLAGIGTSYQDQTLSLLYFFNRTTEDTATIAEDIRGKHYYYPGHDPLDPTSPGHEDPDAAPYLRTETLDYKERTTGTLQLTGTHKLDLEVSDFLNNLALEWTLARSNASLYQPDKRQFGSAWYPGRQIGPFEIPPFHAPFKPSANFTLGNLQRIWKSIDEESSQATCDVTLSFSTWAGLEGYLKGGLFIDQVDRSFDQDTYSNFNDNSTFNGPFAQRWSTVFPYEAHPISESTYDVDYKGALSTRAWYGMIDLPLTSFSNLIGGLRVEKTRIKIVNDPEKDATWFPPGSNAQTVLNKGDGDVSSGRTDLLPSVGMVLTPLEGITFRSSLSRTIARQTFKELTPILQQEYLGGPVFIGNPNLEMSRVTNFDLRLDYVPYTGGLFSMSWFRKDIKQPIEYVQKLAAFNYTTAENYPRGRLTGWEFEIRQDLEQIWEGLRYVSLGSNYTLIRSEVDLPPEQAAIFAKPNIKIDMRKRRMTDAPEYLYNAFITFDPKPFGLNLSLFYTIQGKALIEGATESTGNYVPNVIMGQTDTLNASISQDLGSDVRLSIRAKNLTNPKIKTSYEKGLEKTSYSNGVEYSIGLSAEF